MLKEQSTEQYKYKERKKNVEKRSGVYKKLNINKTNKYMYKYAY